MSSIKRHKLHKTALFNELFQIIELCLYVMDNFGGKFVADISKKFILYYCISTIVQKNSKKYSSCIVVLVQ